MIYASWIYFDGWIHKKPWCIIIFSCRPLISMFCWSLWWSLTDCSDHQTLSSGPRLETRDSGHRDWASLGGFCGCCRLPDGGISWWWSELFRCWLTLNSHLLTHCALTLVTVFAQCAYYLTVHWPDTILLLLGSHWLVTLVCISRLSASDWAEIVWRQRRGQGLVSARAGPATEGQHTGGE